MLESRLTCGCWEADPFYVDEVSFSTEQCVDVVESGQYGIFLISFRFHILSSHVSFIIFKYACLLARLLESVNYVFFAQNAYN
jgi:hypothetical protein